MEVKGVPPMSVLEKAKRKKLYFNEQNEPILKPNSSGTLRKPNGKRLEELMDTEDSKFVDFISRCIEWDVKQRLDPEGALNHEWIMEGLKEIVSFTEEPKEKVS